MDGNAAFVSYSHEDLEFAQRLASDLKSAGAAVWMDKLDIEPGAQWDCDVEQALNSCRQMLLVLSPRSAASPNVLDEIGVALRTNKTILPLMLQDCEVPIRVCRLQYIDFRKDYRAGLNELVRELRQHQDAAAGRPAAPAAAPARPRKHKWRFAIAALVVVGVVWAVAEFSGSKSARPNRPAPSTSGLGAGSTAPAASAPSAVSASADAPVDLQLRQLVGASAAQARKYLGPADDWSRDGNFIDRNYRKRGLYLAIAGASGRETVSAVCFLQSRAGGFSGSSGDPVAGVSPGMTRSAIQARLGLPAGGGKGYSNFNVKDLGDRTLAVNWRGSGADPVAEQICIDQP
ncbi:MAG: toll/interleukin-1 receptor domain-containing protein [Acidobacteriaceae bacterium]